MASVVMLLGGACVNALAFSGSNCLFSMLRSAGVKEERKRHDKAVEQLQAAQPNWSRRRTERHDWINEELPDLPVQTFRDADAAIRLYAQVTGKTLDPLGPEHKLFDFYTPSVDQERTVRSPFSSWEWLRRAWWPTNSPSNPTVGG